MHTNLISSQRSRVALLAFLTAWVASCAPKRVFTPAPVPAWDVVETMTLEAPEDLSERERASFREGWGALRRGDLESAAASLEPLGRRYGRNPTIASALGFLELRAGNQNGASRYFQSALTDDPSFGPAQGGNFLLAMKEGDEETAYDRLLRLKRSYPAHALVEEFETTLQVSVAEGRLREARGLVSSGQYAEAADAYLRALEVAPEAGALYLETAEAEIAADLPDRGVIHARRAAELEPGNAEAFRVLGEASAATGDLRSAMEAYRTAVSLRPNDADLNIRYESVRARFDEENLPEEYLDVRDAERITREQLAALIYLELRQGLDRVGASANVIATDIAGSWASEFIRRVVAAGVLEVYSNHTFQPRGFVTRVELARALARAMDVLDPDAYEIASRNAGDVGEFPDLVRENVSYSDAALAIALDFLSPSDGGAFEPQRFVSGQEAAHAVQMLAARVTP